MINTYRFPFSIAYSDTDAGGIVYHGRYIEIAERARMEMLRGITMPAGDIGFVVHELNIKYMHPLKLADDITVETSIVDVGAAFMKLEQKFVHGDAICAIMNITIAYIGGGMKIRRIPTEIMSKLTQGGIKHE
ncbi:MAG: thioesterase family protein [Alphaproteobacteria bacterium]|nr:thioesterase family protein [Alphaproteobacteria bacterium]